MATHPVDPTAPGSGNQEAEPNTSQLPVDPEFGRDLPPAEPENAGVKQPAI